MNIIASIRIELSDWLYNAGIVGFAKVLDVNDIKYSKGVNYIEFDDSVLDDFGEKYFNYFINMYEPFTSWHKLVSFQSYIDTFDIKKAQEKDLLKINNQIEYMKKKLTSNSYKSGYLLISETEFDLIKEEKKLRKVRKNKKQVIKDVNNTIQEQLENIEKIIKFLKKDKVKKIILAKNVIYDIIQKFWADVSFLHKNNSTKNMFEEYKKYFVNNALDYFKEDKEKYRYSCFSCSNKIGKLSKPAAYDLTWISNMGVDISRKSSHFWNLSGDSYICPICNLIYSCIPAGFTVIHNRGLFINQNTSIDSIIKINKHALQHNITFEELEQDSYFDIIETVNQSSVEAFDKEIDNIQIVKLDAQNNKRPYTFNVLSKDRLRIIYANKNRLRKMLRIHVKIGNNEYLNLYREVITRLYSGKNLFDLISKLIYLILESKFNRLQYVEMIIRINNSYIGGRGKMVYYKNIDSCKKYGLSLREEYTQKKATNKLSGITYRLLNALKTKNVSKFMDTLLSAYMYLNKAIPTTFIEGLKDIEKFQTLGYAFLLGLQGQEVSGNLSVDKKGDIANG